MEYRWSKTLSYAKQLLTQLKQLLKQLKQLLKQLLLTVMPGTGIGVATHT